MVSAPCTHFQPKATSNTPMAYIRNPFREMNLNSYPNSVMLLFFNVPTASFPVVFSGKKSFAKMWNSLNRRSTQRKPKVKKDLSNFISIHHISALACLYILQIIVKGGKRTQCFVLAGLVAFSVVQFYTLKHINCRPIN